MRGSYELTQYTAYLSITLLGSLMPAHGQSVPTKTEAADNLKSVIRQVNLHNPDLPPFHLKAKIHYEVNKRVTDAEYELVLGGAGQISARLSRGECCRYGLGGRCQALRGSAAYRRSCYH